MKKIDLMLFDIDGTLVDSREDVARAVNTTAKFLGRGEKSVAEISSYIGNGVEDLLRQALETDDNFLVGRAVELFTDYRKRHPHDSSVLYPDVELLLKCFSDKKKVIVTNRRREFARITLKALNIEIYFDDIAAADNIDWAKPSPFMLNDVIERYRMARGKAIMIGDMDIDVQAGQNAGLLTCAVTYGLGFREDIIKARPDFIIDNIMDLKDIVQ